MFTSLLKILIHINSNANEQKKQINVKKKWSNSRNPQTIVDIVDNFIPKMWKFEFLHLCKIEIHMVVDKIVNGYIHHPHWHFLILYIGKEQFSTFFQRDIHKLPTICGYLWFCVDFIPFSVERLWLYFYWHRYRQIYIIFLDFNIFMVYNHHDIFWYLEAISPVFGGLVSITWLCIMEWRRNCEIDLADLEQKLLAFRVHTWFASDVHPFTLLPKNGLLSSGNMVPVLNASSRFSYILQFLCHGTYAIAAGNCSAYDICGFHSCISALLLVVFE